MAGWQNDLSSRSLRLCVAEPPLGHWTRTGTLMRAQWGDAGVGPLPRGMTRSRDLDRLRRAPDTQSAPATRALPPAQQRLTRRSVRSTPDRSSTSAVNAVGFVVDLDRQGHYCGWESPTCAQFPNREPAVLRHPLEVVIRGEHRQLVANAKVREERVDGTYLHTTAPAGVAQLGRVDMILPIGHQERDCGESLEDLLARLRAREALQQLLQHETSGNDGLTVGEEADEPLHLRARRRRVPSKRERPDARVDEGAHPRDRSGL